MFHQSPPILRFHPPKIIFMKRNQTYLSRNKKPTQPIKKKEEVQQSNDEHIDQDYPGYPHHPATENIINPKSKEDILSADVQKRSKEND